MKIVALGGGKTFVHCRPPQTLAVDQEIVRLAREGMNKNRLPTVLFIPTASLDDEDYCHGIYQIYNVRLGCRFRHLKILKEKMTDEQIRERIDWADVIYVGGGDTDLMMNEWRKRDIDKLLIKASGQGTVLCGLSAGAICWSQWGASDSLKIRNPDDWEPIKVSGLGLVPFAICPHYDSEGEWRQPAFKNMLKESGSVGIALGEYSAIEIANLCYRVINFRKGGKVLKIFWNKGELHEYEVKAQKRWSPIRELLP